MKTVRQFWDQSNNIMALELCNFIDLLSIYNFAIYDVSIGKWYATGISVLIQFKAKGNWPKLECHQIWKVLATAHWTVSQNLNKMWNAFTLTSLSDCFCKNDIRLFSFASVSVNMAVQKLVHTLKLYDGGEIDRFVLVHQGKSINYWRFLKKQPKFSSKIILALLPTCISYKMSIEVCIAESCIFLPSFLTGLS